MNNDHIHPTFRDLFKSFAPLPELKPITEPLAQLSDATRAEIAAHKQRNYTCFICDRPANPEENQLGFRTLCSVCAAPLVVRCEERVKELSKALVQITRPEKPSFLQ